MSIIVHGVDKPKDCMKCPFCGMETYFENENALLVCKITKEVCAEYTPFGELTYKDGAGSCPIEQVEEKEDVLQNNH